MKDERLFTIFNMEEKPTTFFIRIRNSISSPLNFFQVTDRRTLEYKCNFCHEPIATLLSLSTHVKFHCQRYCKMCYWILRENETMEQHIDNYHRVEEIIYI